MNRQLKKVSSILLIFGCLLVLVASPVHTVHAGIVQGEVIAVEGEYIRIDRGSEAGLKVGDQGRIYYTVLVGTERRVQSITVAGFTITSTDQGSSVAKVEKAQGEIMVGYLVETTLTGAPIEPVIQQEQPPAKQPPAKAVKKKKKVARAEVKPGEIWRDPHLGMSFVWVPGGCFEMGCGEWAEGCGESEIPPHKVCLNGFWMARHEVTQQQWRRLMGDNPSHFNRCGSQCPVEEVSWNEAVEFASQLSAKTGHLFRLPTEAEWEYAARSIGKQQLYAGGEAVAVVAWYKENAAASPHPVGRKRPNDLGIFDMSGNVWEWCLDTFDKEAYLKATRTLGNPVYVNDRYMDIYGEGYARILRILQLAPGYRSVRGGSWGNAADRLRCTDRIRGNPESRRDWLGFRLVREEIKKK
jgi:formylglycine-generating enzyme required for sulfatase activity